MRNPSIGVYAQQLVYSQAVCSYNLRGITLRRAASVDPYFVGVPKDLMAVFVDCFVQLLDLSTSDISSIHHVDPTR